jgi:hypothetical protein
MKVEEEEKLGVQDWIFFLGSDTKGSVECVFFRSDVRVRVNPNVECSCGMWINRKMHIAKCNCILRCAICILQCNMDNFLLNQKGLVLMSMRVNPNVECS